MKLSVKTATLLENSQLTALTSFAGQLADAAGETILPHFRNRLDVDHKPGRGYFDPVTVADRDAETAMRNLIKTHYPGHGIFGEEHGYEEGSGELTWVLDPIDGTRAFITGMPLWGTLIALYDGEKPVIGVVDQPYIGERYIGNSLQSVCTYGSASTNLSTRYCDSLSNAVLMATGPDIFVSEAEQLAFQALVAQCKMVRFGGDCYAYCMLAGGFVDVIVEAGLEPYDIQALIPIVEMAGGKVTNWSGGSAVHGGQVVAVGNPDLLNDVLKVLEPVANQ